MKYVVIELQNGIVGENVWIADTREAAESFYYSKLAVAVVSEVAVHAVVLMTAEGFVIDSKCFKH